MAASMSVPESSERMTAGIKPPAAENAQANQEFPGTTGFRQAGALNRIGDPPAWPGDTYVGNGTGDDVPECRNPAITPAIKDTAMSVNSTTTPPTSQTATISPGDPLKFLSLLNAGPGTGSHPLQLATTTTSGCSADTGGCSVDTTACTTNTSGCPVDTGGCSLDSSGCSANSGGCPVLQEAGCSALTA